ncbi:MAG: hypothetical protein R3F07_15065 [Opitutaceae bacterium]
MPNQPPESDLITWHRYFAIESNNRAWSLTIASRSADEDQEMLDAAHAAAWHWGFAGDELNHMRAKMLLAEVHAQLGNGTIALRHATTMQAWFLSRETPDWEVAFVHAIFARASLAAGDSESYRAAYVLAEKAIAAIGDEDDRKIVIQTFSRIPRPA